MNPHGMLKRGSWRSQSSPPVIKWWHWGVGVGFSSPPSPPWASPEETLTETGSQANPRPDLIAQSYPQLLMSYYHEALFPLAVWLIHTWKATTTNRSFLFSSAVRLLSYCSVTPHVWCSYLLFLCPSQQGGQPGLLSERGQALSAFSVCGGGWEGSFLRVLCLGKEQTALQQEPLWPPRCPASSTQPTIFFSSIPH